MHCKKKSDAEMDFGSQFWLRLFGDTYFTAYGRVPGIKPLIPRSQLAIVTFF